jgi:hypothetical protein
MVTLIFCITMVDDLLVGKLTGKPVGVTKLEVSMKNISNRKIMSVIEDMLKSGLILFLERKFMLKVVVLVTDQ